MEQFLERYDLDTSRPTVRQAWRDALRRAFAPAVALWAGILAVGFLIVGPLENLPEEVAVNEALVDTRTQELNDATSYMSNIGGTQFIIIVCGLAILVLYLRTRRWWFALVPGFAVALQALLFVTSAQIVGRGRPEVEPLDDSPPTSGFPSGHTGASTAFYLTMAMLLWRVRPAPLRWVLVVLALAVPLLVAFARLYRGMHHLSDVIVGFVNGVLCAWLAWRYLRRDTSGADRGAARAGAYAS